ncbi:MAG: hypothetical protein EBR52_08865, partial [Microbacteriaceae bacterium]|nr:hypothetical protein [Microbacteriaceae bacterium]
MHVIVDARCCALKLRFEALPGFLSYGEVGAEEGRVTEYERKEPEVSAQDESFAGTVHPRLGTVELARSGHRGEVVIAIKVVVDAFNPRIIGNGVRVEAGEMRVHDELLGPRDFDPAAQHGDFLVWTKAGVPSYQLACAVDDGELGVTDVVRGADLLESAALQGLLLHALGHAQPRWWHLPLVRDAQGARLAKRDGAEGLIGLQRDGVQADRVRGVVAWWMGAAPLAPITRDA